MSKLFFLIFFVSLAFTTQAKISKNNYLPQSLTVSEVIANGKFLELSDNSLWEIDPADIPKSGGWISSGKITLTHSDSVIYPFLLQNSLTNDSVKAKRSSKKNLKQGEEIKRFEKQEAKLKQKKQQEKAKELSKT